MPDYKKMYFELFNGITDTIENLKKLQMEAEEKIINCENKPCKSSEDNNG